MRMQKQRNSIILGNRGERDAVPTVGTDSSVAVVALPNSLRHSISGKGEVNTVCGLDAGRPNVKCFRRANANEHVYYAAKRFE
jgi:hypothetical protein